MCCYNNAKSVKSMKARLKKNGGWVWGYKELYVKHNKIMSLYRSGFVWKPGWNKARGVRPDESDRNEIYFGIHVYRHKLKWYNNANPIIRVKCYAKDLIGADEYTAVFKKVFLYKKDYLEALNNG